MTTEEAIAERDAAIATAMQALAERDAERAAAIATAMQALAERDAERAAHEATRVDRDRLAERESYFAHALDVADGGQYRADWPGAIGRLIRERDRLAGEVAGLRATALGARAYLHAVGNVDEMAVAGVRDPVAELQRIEIRAREGLAMVDAALATKEPANG